MSYAADRDDPLFELRRAIAAELAVMAEEARHEANRPALSAMPGKRATLTSSHPSPTGPSIA